MALGCPTQDGVEWRLRDLVLASLLAVLFLVPLTAAALPRLQEDRWNQVILGVCLEALAVIPAVAVTVRRRGIKHLRQFGLGRYPWKRCLLLGLAGGAVLIVVVQGCGGIMEAFGMHLDRQSILAETLLARGHPGRLFLFLLAAAMVAPLWEEIFFRGLAYRVLRQRLGALGACLLSGLLFAMLHAEPWLLRLPIFLLGVLLAAFFEWSGSLYVPMAAHSAANTFSILLAYLGLAR